MFHCTIASAMKFEVQLFDGKVIHYVAMHNKRSSVQQGLDTTLEEEKPVKIKDTEWKSIQRKVTSTITLALAPTVKYIVLNETTPTEMWKRLEEIYALKSLTNYLSFKIDLYTLRMEKRR